MTHQPYREWILSEADGPLPPDQRTELEAHLSACEACRALRARLARLEDALASAPMLAPAPGFAARFEARRVERQSRARWAIGGLLLLLGGTALLGIVAFAVFRFLGVLPGDAALAALLTALNVSVPILDAFGEALLLGAHSLLAWAAGQPILMACALAGLVVAAFWVHVIQRVTMEAIQ